MSNRKYYKHIPKEKDPQRNIGNGILVFGRTEKKSGNLMKRPCLSIGHSEPFKQVEAFSGWPNAPIREPHQEFLTDFDTAQVFAHLSNSLPCIRRNREGDRSFRFPGMQEIVQRETMP